MVVYSAACVAAPPPPKVESRRDASKPWNSYKAYTVDRIPGFTPSPDPALDAGWLVHTQDERGIFYQNFVNELIKGGACVGWHWFKYGDNDPTDPLNDPSNRDSNKGLVTWDYRHYEPLAGRMREINNCTYNLSRFHENAAGGRTSP